MKRIMTLILGIMLVCSLSYATVTDQTQRVQYTASAGQTVFAYTWRVLDDSDMDVFVDGVLTTAYSVSNVGVLTGGNVTFNTGRLVGEIITILRNMPNSQETSYPAGGRLSTTNLELNLDRLTMFTQDLAEEVARATKMPGTSTLTNIDYPIGTSATDRATKLAAWNSTGTSLDLVTATSADSVSLIAVKGDILQGGSTGVAEKLAIGTDRQVPYVATDKLAYRDPFVFSVKDFGATGDGTTDDTTAITTAMAAAAGGILYFPEGTYAIEVDTDPMFTPGANTTIRGSGRDSIIRFNMTDASEYQLFAISNADIRFEDIRIEVNTSVTAGVLVLFQWGGTNFSLDNVEIDGNVTNAIGSSHALHVIKCDETGSFNDLRITNCDWHEVTRFWLRTNTATSTILRVQIENNRFSQSEASMFAFNGVKGSITDVTITNNIFTDPFINAVQSDSFCLGPQVKNCTIQGNTFRGDGHEAIHIEETAVNIAVTGNIIDMDLANAAIVTIDNSVSGGSVTPKRITITGNTIKRTDADGSTGNGIELTNDGGDPPVSSIVIADNVINGWGIGILVGSEADDLHSIHNNIIDGCATGVSAIFGLPGFEDNLLANCTTGIVTISGGGTFGFTRFYKCTTKLAPVSGNAVLLGFREHFDRTDIAATAAVTDFAIVPITANDRLYGWFTGNVFFNDANEDTDMSELLWDGSTIATNTNKIAIGGGQLGITWVDASSVLTMRVSNSGAELANASVYVEFNGTYVGN